MIKKYISTIKEEILGLAIGCIFYLVVSTICIWKIQEFNEDVVNIKDPFTIMSIYDGIAWKLLSYAVILIIFAVVIIVYSIKRMKEIGGYSILTLVVFLTFIVANGIRIFIVINNPILQCALVIIGMTSAFIGMNAID